MKSRQCKGIIYNVLAVLDNISTKYPETKEYIKKNMKEVCERRKITFI